MNNDDLKKTQDNLDNIIKQSSAVVSGGNTMPNDRDRAIVMACAAITKSYLPEPSGEDNAPRTEHPRQIEPATGSTWKEFPEYIREFLEPKMEIERRNEIESWEICRDGKILVKYKDNPAKGLVNREAKFFFVGESDGIA